MAKDQWIAVDKYIADRLLPPDPALDSVLESISASSLPPISVSPTHGRLLFLLAKLIGARRILEIGTLGGYSTICLARALPANGRLVTLEIDPKHADVARKNFERAHVTDVIDLRLGSALETLPQLAAQGAGPFDMIFIDADKKSYPEYLSWAITLSRSGSLIIADNVVRDGAVVDIKSTDVAVQSVRRFNDALASDPRLMATEIQTVGVKGYDGFAFVVVK